MTGMLESEQWKRDGICSRCRRQNYCSKPCKRNETRVKSEIAAFIAERTGMGVIRDTLGAMKGGKEW